MVFGDIKCDKFDLNGSVKGNAEVQTSAVLGNCASMKGNLTAQYLSIQNGAVVNGAIDIDRDSEHKKVDQEKSFV